jgi:hypothetical protein
VKVGKTRTCVPAKLALPPPSKTNSILAGVQGALAFTKLGFTTDSGKRVKSFRQRLGPSWAIAEARLQKAVAVVIGRAQPTGRRPLGAFAAISAGGAEGMRCAAADVADDYGSDPGGNTVSAKSTASVAGTEVSMNLDANGAHIGVNANVNGYTIKMKYDSGEFSCLAYQLPPCPQGDGELNASGIKGRTGFSLLVSKDGSVLKKESYTKTTTVETRGKVADDAKLDTVEVKYSEATSVVLDGTRLSQYGNRNVTIDMRKGSYGPGESVSFGSATVGGESANVVGVEADAKEFASFVSQAISAYRDRENAWQTPNSCARLKFNPGSNSLTLAPGQQGSFSAEVDTATGGERASKASWTLGAQQNASFSPAGSKDPQPNFSYEASSSPSGETVSVLVKATSSAGVAQETWSQKIAAINKISGTFSGHQTEEGVVFDWSGTATFTRSHTEAGGSVFMLTAGTATVSVSGGIGCTYAGTEQIPLSPLGFFTLMGTGNPVQYQIESPFDNTYAGGGVTETCGMTSFDVTKIPGAPAIQSGAAFPPGGTVRTSTDGATFADSAGESVLNTANWTWSLKGEAS